MEEAIGSNTSMSQKWVKEVHHDVRKQAPVRHTTLFMCREYVAGLKTGDH